MVLKMMWQQKPCPSPLRPAKTRQHPDKNTDINRQAKKVLQNQTDTCDSAGDQAVWHYKGRRPQRQNGVAQNHDQNLFYLLFHLAKNTPLSFLGTMVCPLKRSHYSTLHFSGQVTVIKHKSKKALFCTITKKFSFFNSCFN